MDGQTSNMWAQLEGPRIITAALGSLEHDVEWLFDNLCAQTTPEFRDILKTQRGGKLWLLEPNCTDVIQLKGGENTQRLHGTRYRQVDGPRRQFRQWIGAFTASEIILILLKQIKKIFLYFSYFYKNKWTKCTTYVCLQSHGAVSAIILI
jgi:hypothetical protein